MLTKLYWIEENIAISPRPNAGDRLLDEINYWLSLNIKLIVCLLTKSEMKELALENEQFECEKNGFDFIHFPILDRQVPESYLQSKALIESLCTKLKENNKVIIHCRAGIGRSSMIAAGLLIKKGFKVNEALEKISEIRQLNVPDTAEQIEWLKELAEILNT